MPSKNIIKMSAAGSGKTWNICHEALEIVLGMGYAKRVLITTYTNKGIDSIKAEIKKQNHGVLCDKIIVKSWYQFLLSDLLRPYQTYIAEINEIKSFDFSKAYGYVNRVARGKKGRYISKGGNVLSNYASELAIVLNEKSNGAVVERLEKIYSHIFIDEIQDLTGDDLNIIDLLFASQIVTTCVGDNKQATYKTHNTRKNKNQSGSKIWDFFETYQESGTITVEHCLVSRRFNSDICHFANTVFPNENIMTTSMTETSIHDGVYLIMASDAVAYLSAFNPTVLRYDVNTTTDSKSAYNFGQCKGCTFERVLIYPNKPLTDFVMKGVALKSAYKYYVAVTRAKYSMAIVVKELSLKTNDFLPVTIDIGGSKIPALKYNVNHYRF